MLTHIKCFCRLDQLQLNNGYPVLNHYYLTTLVTGIMPILKRPHIHTNNDDEHYETSVERQAKADRNYDTLRNYNSIPVESTIAVQGQDTGAWTHGTTVEKSKSHND